MFVTFTKSHSNNKDMNKTAVVVPVIGTKGCQLYLPLTSIKVKLSLCLIKHYAMKTYGGVEV
jgi:hypothetical protein